MNLREKMIDDLVGEDGKVQYDGNDEAKITNVAGAFANASVLMIEALGAYVDAMNLPVDENSADIMKGARNDVIYSWTAMQGSVSRIAHLLRFDGDEAYRRAVETAKEGNEDEVTDFNDL
jgi:hypothetical protein